jgi:hypothetical protein
LLQNESPRQVDLCPALMCSRHQKTVPIPHQRTRLLLNRWAAATDKKGEVLSALLPAEFEELLILAGRKLTGLQAALDYTLSR